MKKKKKSMHVKIHLIYNKTLEILPHFLTNAFPVFDFTPFGWLRNKKLPTAYETHGAQHGCEAMHTM